MSVYTVLRKIHLYTGLALMTFVVMYFVTGYPMIHHEWFPDSEPRETVRTEPLEYADIADPDIADPESYALYLQETFDLRGKRQRQRQRDDGSWRFDYFRPGTDIKVVVALDGKSVTITTREHGAKQTLIGFHRLHGYGGGWLYDLWVVFYDLASLSLIVFAFSGIYLWYRLTRRRLLGWIFLGISYGYAGATMLYLTYAP